MTVRLILDGKFGSYDRKVRLPLEPFPGLVLILSSPAEKAGVQYKVKSVVFDEPENEVYLWLNCDFPAQPTFEKERDLHAEAGFVCSQQW